MPNLHLPSLNLDAADTVWFTRQLEALDSKDYSELLPGSLARKFIPDVEGVPEYAPVYTYRMYKMMGRAKVSADNANDAPRSSLTATEASNIIKEIDNSYGWTLRELQMAAATRTPLDSMSQLAARTATAQEIDYILAKGSTTHNLAGLLSLSDVDPAACTPTTKTSGVTWANTANTADQVLADINKVTTTLFQRLKQTDAPGFQKFVLLVPTAAFARIATTPRSSTSDTTILRYALENNPWLESIEPWYHCDDAGASSVGRLVAYPRNPLCLGGLVPAEFKSLKPQEMGKEIKVPTVAYCGGVVCRYPVAVQYMDGI